MSKAELKKSKSSLLSSRNLGSLFNFSSLAFVGASDNAHFGLGVYRALCDIGFDGGYFPVNVKRDTVHGVRAYPSASEIPGSIDAAVISVARQHVLRAFEQCADKGARAIVVLSSNFGERDEEGKLLQQKLADMAHERDVILVGPNCMGAASVINGCALYQGRGLDKARPGGVAVVSQSGGLMNEVLHYGNARALGFSHLISSGNEADVTLSQAMDYYIDDPVSKIILIIVETVREPDHFLSALNRAVAAGKPIVVLKLGASEKGARSALTHTGALAGNDEVWDALLRQRAAIRVHDIDEMVDVAAMLNGAVSVLPTERTLNRMAVIEISGGGTELICDLAEASGLSLPEPSSEVVSAIQPTLPEFLYVGNPIDTGTVWVNPAMGQIYPVALEALASQNDYDIIVSRYIVPSEGELGGLHDRLEEFKQAREAHPDRLFVVITPTSNPYIDEWREALAEYNVPFVPGFKRGFSALGKVAAYSVALAALKSDPPPERPRTKPIEGRHGTGLTILNEVESKDLLHNAGLPVVDTRLARTAEEACTIGKQLGFPVVAKVVSPQMTHKSDAGGVRLQIASISELATVFEEFKALVGRNEGAQFDGIAIQPMARPGLEIVLGAQRDPQFGPVLMFGLGGIFVEVLKDITLRVAPISEVDAHSMLEEIRAKPLLDGARGQPAVDRSSVIDALLRLSELMLERDDIDSIDVNPAFVGPDGLLVVDARIVLAGNSAG